MAALPTEAVPADFDEADEDESLMPDSIPEGLPSAVFAPRSRHFAGARQNDTRWLDELPVGVVLFDAEQNIRHANPAHRQLLGWDMIECGGIEPWLRSGCRDGAAAAEVVQQWREHLWQKQLTSVLSLRSADDRLREIECVPRLLADGGLLLTFHDVTESHRIEDALRLTDAKFRAVFEGADTPVALIDRTGRFIEANPAFENLLGYSPGDLRRLGIEEWVALADVERLRQAEAALLGRPIPRQQGMIGETTLSLQLRPREGILFPARVRLSAVVGPKGRAWFTALRVENDDGRLADRALLEALPDLILSMDRHGRIEEVFPPSTDWAGVAAGPDWIGRNVVDCWPGFAERAAAKVTATIDRGEFSLLRFMEPSPGDPSGQVAYSVRFAPALGQRAVVMVTDATADAELVESLARQAGVFRHLEDGIILTNLRGRISDWNAAAGRSFGRELAEVRGQGLALLYARADGEAEFNAELSRALTEKSRWERRGTFFRKDGGTGRCEAFFIPVMEGGVPRSLLGVHREIEEETEELTPLWRGWLETIGSLVALDSQSPRLPVKIQGWLRAAALAPDEETGLLANYTRQLISDLLRATAGARQGGSVQFELRVEEGLTADRASMAAFGMMLSELTLPAMLLVGAPGRSQPAMVLRRHEGDSQLILLLRVPEEAVTGLSLPVLKQLAIKLRGRLTSARTSGMIEWALRFPGRQTD
jgi:PAS domain S-box-containing protein